MAKTSGGLRGSNNSKGAPTIKSVNSSISKLDKAIEKNGGTEKGYQKIKNQVFEDNDKTFANLKERGRTDEQLKEQADKMIAQNQKNLDGFIAIKTKTIQEDLGHIKNGTFRGKSEAVLKKYIKSDLEAIYTSKATLEYYKQKFL